MQGELIRLLQDYQRLWSPRGGQGARQSKRNYRVKFWTCIYLRPHPLKGSQKFDIDKNPLWFSLCDQSSQVQGEMTHYYRTALNLNLNLSLNL